MNQVKDAVEGLMGWIQANYYEQMSGLLTAEGFKCEPIEEAPWYRTDCPRSKAMALHNEALTRLLLPLKDTPMPLLAEVMLVGALNRKYFSDRDIKRQTALEQKAAQDGH